MFPKDEFAVIGTHPAAKSICKICDRARVAYKVAKVHKDDLLGKLAMVVKTGKKSLPTDLPTLGDVVGGMVEKFGGFDSFLTIWHQHIMAQFAANPGGKTGLDHMYAIAKMAGETQKIETQRRAVDRLTEAERMEEIGFLLKRMQHEEETQARIVDAREP